MNLLNAHQLIHKGILALARAERQGIRVDLELAEETHRGLDTTIGELNEQFKKSKLFKHWQHSKGPGAVNIDSNFQLSHFLYKVKKLTPAKTTPSGQGAVDEEALQALNIPELKDLLRLRKLKKMQDYLNGFLSESVDGFIHPVFNLHTVSTYRSCVAKGSKVLVVRDFEKHPKGVPIEDVKVGDYVYCFDNDLAPAIRQVKWAGKTGHKEIVRVHWSSRGGGGKGYLDVTPEHLIRLIDGSYEQAQNLDPKNNVYRSPETSKREPRVNVLSCKRAGDTLRFTGHLKHGNGVLESHLIYSHFHGVLRKGQIIHHKNHNHFDHTPSNLEKTNLSDHSRHHGLNRPEEVNKRCIQSLHENRHKIKYKKGFENPLSLKLSKFKCLMQLSKARGQIKRIPHDFGVLKKYLKMYGIDLRTVKDRYDKNEQYIFPGLLKQFNQPVKISNLSTTFKINYQKAQRMLIQRQISFTVGESRNPYGRAGLPGNHMITKVEWIGKKVDVYDLEVEDFHNFFANELCVHNSSDSPNFHNIPVRDEEAKKIIRSCLFPRKGHQLLEVDFSGIEVGIAACYHKDPTMIKYIKDPTTDMHGDMAKQIFFLDKLDKKDPTMKALRGGAKNGFVFPQFYGDYYGNNALGLSEWAKLPLSGKYYDDDGLMLPSGITVGQHLIGKGIKSITQFTEHIKDIEEDFWRRRFPVYDLWRKKWWKRYQQKGYFDMYTGFRCYGVFNRKEVCNYPVQGAAFHCLLWCFIEIDRIMREEKWNTKLIGQIHDSMVFDVDPSELSHVLKTVRRVTEVDLLKAWDWIIVPLTIEAEICEVDQSWYHKKELKLVE